MNMEYHMDTLQKALLKLPDYEPKEALWADLSRELDEIPLQDALLKLPEYEPGDSIWAEIERTSSIKPRMSVFWLSAAVMLIVGGFGIWVFQTANAEPVSYTQEAVDLRLQVNQEPGTDEQYQKLKASCEVETLVCGGKDFKRLKQEYEKLDVASNQLKQAMGEFNTEPELVRQFDSLEQEKAAVLNEMAKMI